VPIDIYDKGSALQHIYYYFLPSVHMIPRGFRKLLEKKHEHRYEQSVGAVISR